MVFAWVWIEELLSSTPTETTVLGRPIHPAWTLHPAERIRPDLVHADGCGQVTLLLRAGDRVEDRS